MSTIFYSASRNWVIGETKKTKSATRGSKRRSCRAEKNDRHAALVGQSEPLLCSGIPV
jgi:hypothetical protein